jgi:ElaB/YqjD/DUF883 family membrane-anchored ribosome-binding protein
MTDLYIENDPDPEPGMLEQLRARLVRLEHRMGDSASGAVEDARFLMRRTQHRINAQLGTAALVAFGAGIVLGLLATAVSAQRRRSRER